MNVNKKKRNDDLILIADQALNETGALFEKDRPGIIQDSYNGQIAALPVSIAMSGLLPALTIYYQDKGECKSKVNRRAILTVIARMISKDKANDLTYENAEALYKGIINDKFNPAVKSLIIACSIALKQVVRTYKLEKS